MGICMVDVFYVVDVFWVVDLLLGGRCDFGWSIYFCVVDATLYGRCNL